jgi:hypothetical protein
MRTNNQDRNQDLRMFEALLCTLIARAGGQITLPAQQVAAQGNSYRLGLRPDWATHKLTLTVLELRCPPGQNCGASLARNQCRKSPLKGSPGLKSSPRLGVAAPNVHRPF